VHFVDQRAKTDLLASLLSQRPDDLSLVFARTKHGAEKLMKSMEKAGLSAASIHGNKSQGQRERAIKAFREGEIRVLVATDVAARGIDIPGVSHVYNFDLPEVAESYVHRIGRTARAGAEGLAVSFCSPADMHLLRGIEKLTGIPLEVAGGTAPSREAAARPPTKSRRNAAMPSASARDSGPRAVRRDMARRRPSKPEPDRSRRISSARPATSVAVRGASAPRHRLSPAPRAGRMPVQEKSRRSRDRRLCRFPEERPQPS
jgi:ATP-dependent RNA helicase RhlE